MLEEPKPRRKIPMRTLILLILALLATLRFLWISHERSQAEPVLDVRPLPSETRDR